MEVTHETPRIVPVKEPADRLKEILEGHRGERHIIAIRGYPDPDSIGSAMAHQYVATHYDISASIRSREDFLRALGEAGP